MIHKRAVVKALRAARVRFQETRKLIHLWCPYHPDRETPSLVIYTQKDPPSFYCFGCRAHGTWEALATSLKMGSKLDRDWDDPRAAANLEADIRSIVSRDPCLPPLARPWTLGKWRQFSSEVLESVRAQWWYDDIDRVRRIVWPVWAMEKQLIGWVGRDIDNEKGSPRKYRNMPNMNAVKTLYPLPMDKVYPERTVILVEGIPDALRLLQAGLPALANLGTAWSKTRTCLLMALEIERVILAFDGDEAGHRANQEIGEKLYPLGVTREVWEWPEGSDPGDAPYEEIKKLRREVLPRGAPKEPHPWLYSAPTIQRHWLADFQKEN